MILHPSFTNKILSCLRVNSSIIFLNGAKSFSSMMQSHAIQERKVDVDGVDVNYLSVGTGKHTVLLLPGAAGSIWTDFKPQIEGLSKEKFTIVAWDPPGYGKSRPPDRTFPDDFFERDAAWARNLMKVLGHEKYSLIGWSDGGITSLILAAMYPENVRKMVAVAANSYIVPEEIEIYKKFRDIDTWSEKMRAPMIAIYGEEYFRKIWTGWVDSVSRIYEKRNGNLCKELLSKIKCPSLIVQGKKDAMVFGEHPIYLKDHITEAKLKIFENGAHNLHLRYPEEFNTLVTEFFTE
ncbi:serine hydrolase BPHL-like [Colletes latitarsis]|uniref:serine hydrolase BPHL-like n=1 Tax=Colletes latitarsis TaxID=2605962 RepID=UPI0040363DDE